jgi:hypothetical protein
MKREVVEAKGLQLAVRGSGYKDLCRLPETSRYK